MTANLAAVAYIVSGVLFILALRGLSSPVTSRRGNQLGMIGMAIAVATTLLTLWRGGVLDATTLALIGGGVAIGGGAGAMIARRVKMTAMPQLVAAFHSLVGLAACLVAAAALYTPAAYGIAVSLTMLMTSVLLFIAMREIWGWSLPVSLVVAGLFVIVDLTFVTANMMKVFEGGFVPLVVAAVIFLLIWTWRRGRELMLQKLERDTMPLSDFITQVHDKSRVPGTAIYLTSRTDVVPVPLLHNLKHNKVIHRRIVLLHVVTDNVPYVAADERIQIADLTDNFYSVVVRYGFMEQPNIPKALDACGAKQLHFDLMDTSFFVGRMTIVPARASRLGRIRTKVFEAMHRNALAATEFFRIPPNRVIELGGQIEI